jgi:hypothetical protein
MDANAFQSTFGWGLTDWYKSIWAHSNSRFAKGRSIAIGSAKVFIHSESILGSGTVLPNRFGRDWSDWKQW